MTLAHRSAETPPRGRQNASTAAVRPEWRPLFARLIVIARQHYSSEVGARMVVRSLERLAASFVVALFELTSGLHVTGT